MQTLETFKNDFTKIMSLEIALSVMSCQSVNFIKTLAINWLFSFLTLWYLQSFSSKWGPFMDFSLWALHCIVFHVFPWLAESLVVDILIDGIQTNVTQFFPVLKPTELRTDPNYSIYFNWFRFVAIGVIPFGLLVLFNAKIYSDIKVILFCLFVRFQF